jgi:hypothetical protein
MDQPHLNAADAQGEPQHHYYPAPPPSPSPFFSPFPLQEAGSGLFPPTPAAPAAAGGGGPSLLTPFFAAIQQSQGLLLPSPTAAMAALSHDHDHEQGGMELEDDGLMDFLGGGGGLQEQQNHEQQNHCLPPLDMTPAALLRLPLQGRGGGGADDDDDDPILLLLCSYLEYERAFAVAVAREENAAALPPLDTVRAALSSLRAEAAVDPAAAGAGEEGTAAVGADDDGGGEGTRLLLAKAFVARAQAALDCAVSEAQALAAEEAAFWAQVEADAVAWGEEGQETNHVVVVMAGQGEGKKKGKGKKEKTASSAASAATASLKPPRSPSASSSASAGRQQQITKLASSSIAPLVAWLLEHYPGRHAPTTDEEKKALARASGLTEKQVVGWFSNYK